MEFHEGYTGVGQIWANARCWDERGEGTKRRRSGEHESHATAIHRGPSSFCRFDGTSTRHEESRGHEGKGTKEVAREEK